MKVVLKKVGQEPQLVELGIEDNPFGARDEIKKVLGADFAIDRMAIDKASGLYLYVGELAEGGANFDIKTDNPYFPTQTIMGDCLLTRYMNDEGWAIYGDMSENELELMKALVNMNDDKVIECINTSRENLTDEERDLLLDEAIIKRQMLEMLRGLGR